MIAQHLPVAYFYVLLHHVKEGVAAYTEIV
jgi:hypothetical protein